MRETAEASLAAETLREAEITRNMPIGLDRVSEMTIISGMLGAQCSSAGAQDRQEFRKV